jgi:hypothetical protein
MVEEEADAYHGDPGTRCDHAQTETDPPGFKAHPKDEA